MFTPHTKDDLKAMLDTIGVSEIDELFNCLPGDHMYPNLELSPALTEMEVLTELQHKCQPIWWTEGRLFVYHRLLLFDHAAPAQEP